jgi:membrane-bound lytic murein transglycosylase B
MALAPRKAIALLHRNVALSHAMLTRRLLLAAAPAVMATQARAAPDSFQGFLVSLRAEARRAGISQTTLDRALAGIAPNQKVLDRDRHQPEFTLTWARYRALVINDKRIADGRETVAANRALLGQVQDRFAVGAGVVSGIWGLESGFGAITGDFHVVEALATLAWDGRRASFFRGELIAALKILEHGDIAPARMTGSYAGAMGQPQFMPSSYLRYAVDFEGHGRRDIWTSKPDVLGSIANYLARSGWRRGETWGQPVTLPPGTLAQGRDVTRPAAEWARQGVQPASGRWAAPGDAPAALLAPDGAGGDAFLVFPNFAAIRRYNPSDFYALAVGLLGDQVLA